MELTHCAQVMILLPLLLLLYLLPTCLRRMHDCVGGEGKVRVTQIKNRDLPSWPRVREPERIWWRAEWGSAAEAEAATTMGFAGDGIRGQTEGKYLPTIM